MENSIILKIGTVFSGEGLTKLQKGVKEANMHIQKGISVANGLAGVMAGVDTSASRTASSLMGLMQGFAQGGVSGAVFAGVVLAINSHVREMQEELERTKKEAAEFESKLNKAFSENLVKRIQSSIDHARSLGTEFERVAKHAEQVAAAIAGLNSAQSSGGIIALQTAKLNATMGEMDSSLRETISAAYDLKIAQAKLAAVEESGAAKVEAARQAYLTNQERIVTIQSQIASIDQAIANQKKAASAISVADEAKAAEITKSIAALEKERITLIENRKQAESNSTALEIKWQTASQENRNAIAQNTNEVLAATQAESDLKRAITERARAEEQKMAEHIDKQARDFEVNANKEQLTNANQSLAKARQDAAKAEADVKASTEKLKAAIESYNANIGQNMTQDVLRDYYSNRDPNKSLQNGMGEVMKSMGDIGKAAGQAAVDAAVAKGEIRTTAEYDRVYKEAARQERINAYKDAARANVDDARAERLARMSQKAMSATDRDWLDKYRATQESRNRDAAAVAAAEAEKINAEARKADADKAITEAAGDIKIIKDKLSKLGLK